MWKQENAKVYYFELVGKFMWDFQQTDEWTKKKNIQQLSKEKQNRQKCAHKIVLKFDVNVFDLNKPNQM